MAWMNFPGSVHTGVHQHVRKMTLEDWREDTGSYVIRVGRSKAILCKSVKFFFPTYCVILSI